MRSSPLRVRIFDLFLPDKALPWQQSLQAILLTLVDKVHRLEEQSQAASPTVTEPASSPSFAATTGIAETPWESYSGMGVAPRVSLREERGSLVLTVATGDSSRSIWCTWPEWEALRIFCSNQPSMSVWLMTYGESKDGPPGPAGHEFAAPAPAAARSGSSACPTHDGEVCGDCEEMWMGKGPCKVHHPLAQQRP